MMVNDETPISYLPELVDHDLPRLADAVQPVLGRRPSYAVLKGRHHYLCLARLEGSTEDEPEDTLFDAPGGGGGTKWLGEAGRLGKQMQRVRDWAMETGTGDRDEIVFAGRAPLPAQVAEVMGAEPGAEVVVRRRHLFGQDPDRPEEIGASYIPLEIAGGTFLEEPTVAPKGLFLCIEELSGKRYAKARDHWVARLPTAEEAAILSLPTGSPVMHVIHVVRAKDGTVLEVSESVWPADRLMVIDEYDVEPVATEPETPSDV